MKLRNEIYNVLKWVLIIFTPALLTFIGTMGKIYNFDTTTILLTISAVATFLGSLVGISNVNYYKSKEK